MLKLLTVFVAGVLSAVERFTEDRYRREMEAVLGEL